jgi:hypothetical protein
MSKFPGSSTAKRNAPFVSHMDGRQVTQRGLPTDREPGNALEKQDGSPSKERPDCSGFFYYPIKDLIHLTQTSETQKYSARQISETQKSSPLYICTFEE